VRAFGGANPGAASANLSCSRAVSRARRPVSRTLGPCAAALLLAPLWACVGRGPQAPTAPVASAGADPASDLVGGSAAALADALARIEGYRLEPGLERGFLAPGARALLPLVLEPLTCTAIVAVASPSVADLDAALYTPDGAVLAEDDASDPRPVVRMCTGKQRLTAYLALYAFQGTGSYAAARMTRPRKDSDPLPAADDDVSGSPEFLELVRALHNRGYQDEGPSTRLPLVSGAPLRLAAKVVAGQCYSMVADGEALHLRLFDDEGLEVAQGVGEKGPAALQYCASRSGEFALELSARGATRVAQLARFRAAQAAVGGARAAWLGEPVPATDAEPQAGEVETPRQCRGPAQPLAKQVALAQGHVLELALPRAGGCARIVAQLHQGLTRLTLRAENAQGAELASQEVRGASGALQVCAAAPASRIMVIARAGFGAVSVTRQACQ
jgi:hypothetical protein